MSDERLKIWERLNQTFREMQNSMPGYTTYKGLIQAWLWDFGEPGTISEMNILAFYLLSRAGLPAVLAISKPPFCLAQLPGSKSTGKINSLSALTQINRYAHENTHAFLPLLNPVFLDWQSVSTKDLQAPLHSCFQETLGSCGPPWPRGRLLPRKLEPDFFKRNKERHGNGSLCSQWQCHQNNVVERLQSEVVNQFSLWIWSVASLFFSSACLRILITWTGYEMIRVPRRGNWCV